MNKYIAISVALAALVVVSAKDEPESTNREPKIFFNRGWGWKRPVETVYITYPKKGWGWENKGWGWEGGYGGGGGGGGGWGWGGHHPYDDHHPIHVFGKHKQQGWGGWGGWGSQGGGLGGGGGGFGGGGFGGGYGGQGWGWGSYGGGGGGGGKKGGKGGKGGKKGGGGGYERAIAGPGPYPYQFVRVPVPVAPVSAYDDDVPEVPIVPVGAGYGVPVQSVYGGPEPFYDDPYETPYDAPSYYDDSEYYY